MRMGGFSWLHPTAAAAGDPHSRSLRRPKPIFWVNLLALWAAAEHSIAQSQPGGLLYSRIPVLSGQDLGVPFFRRNITRIWYLTASPEAPRRESVRSSCRAENQHGAPRTLLEPIVYCRFKIGGAGTIASTFALTLRVAFTCGTAPPMPADPAGVTI